MQKTLRKTGEIDLTESVYSSFVQAKNGSPIPLYKNGHAAHSRYNPEHEAQVAVDTLTVSCCFFVLIGFGGGYVAHALLQRRSDIKIIAIEQSESDIDFLKGEPFVAEIINDKRVTLVSLDKIIDVLKEQYLPAFYGDMHIAYLRSWVQENSDGVSMAKSAIEQAMKLISADYSVQSHFGKIWQRNILCNLQEYFSRYNIQRIAKEELVFPTDKIAFVVAAGPTLDKTVEILNRERDKYFVIATDTAYGVLSRRGIDIDVAVSIDAQSISRLHFFTENTGHNTLFVFDVAGTTCAVRRVGANSQMYFVSTGHPLATYAEMLVPNFSLTKIDSGAGTVTIAAADFANKAGFKSIVVAGADFAYVGGKAYARGTYLDTLYNEAANRLFTAETQFDALLYRVPLEHNGDRATTSILKSYEQTFIKWACKSGFEITKNENNWNCVKKNIGIDDSSETLHADRIIIEKKNEQYLDVSCDFKKFITKIADDINKVEFCPNGNFSPLHYAVLPYVAWLRAHGGSSDFASLLQVAYNSFLEYNI